MLKFPVDGGIVTIYNTAAPPKECNTVTCDVTQTQRQHATKVTNLKVAIHPDYPEQEVSIGGSLSDTGRAAVCALLQRNLDIFAWEPKHMIGITEHKLKIRQGYSPVRQKKRGQAPEHAKSILEEVHKLVEAEAEEAFMQLKQHIAALPTLVAPRPGEELIMYLSATHGAISAVLLTDRDSVQTPVYFVSKALKETDALSKIASTSFAHLSKQVLVEILKNKSISEMEISTVIEEQDPTWMTPIIEFISKGTLPHEQKDARRIRRTAQRFELRRM
ncbi:reverse transcriptase domain-containing protein [Tanacetum coccineum]